MINFCLHEASLLIDMWVKW